MSYRSRSLRLKFHIKKEKLKMAFHFQLCHMHEKTIYRFDGISSSIFYFYSSSEILSLDEDFFKKSFYLLSKYIYITV